MIRFCEQILLLMSLSAVLPAGALAENWPMWRGPRGDGTSTETNVPVRWSAEENIAWKVRIPYTGHASPIVWDDYIFLAGADVEAKERVLMALDRRSGRLRWKRVVLRAPLETKHTLNSYASSTPATDGELVYVTFLEVDGRTIPAPNVGRPRPVTPGRMLVAAYDFDGNLRWRTRPGPFISAHGFCSSPTLYNNLVIVNGDHDGDAYLVALDRSTGQTVWKTPRENKTRSYATPIIRHIGGRPQMMLAGSKCVASYDPRDGSRQWIIDGPTEQFVASAVYSRGLLFITGGFPDKHILAIDPRGTGNITSTHIRWHHKRKGVSYVPSPVAAGPFFYVVSDDGIGTCFEAETGKINWQQRLGGRHSSSLVATNEHVYFTNDDGITRVVKVGPVFQLAAENRLGEAVDSSPAISAGQLFIRTQNHLFSIGRTERR